METPVEYNAGKKEEKPLRIAIYETAEKIIEGGYGDFYNTLNRKTAVERIAKGIHKYDCSWNKKELPIWQDLNEDIQNDYKRQAEFALEALLCSK